MKYEKDTSHAQVTIIVAESEKKKKRFNDVI